MGAKIDVIGQKVVSFIMIQKIHLASRLFIRTVSGFPVILWVRKSEGCGLPSSERKVLQADYRVAVSVAENSAVLLKNEKGVLPLAKGCKAVFLGEFAEPPVSGRRQQPCQQCKGQLCAGTGRRGRCRSRRRRDRKKDDDASSMSMMMGIQLNTLIDFHVLTEEQLNGILSQINQA